MEIGEIENFNQWVYAVMQQPPLLGFLAVKDGRFKNIDELGQHNQVVTNNLQALKQRMVDLCSDPDLIEYDPDTAKKIIVASIFHETARETKAAASHYLTQSIKLLGPEKAIDAVTNLFEEIAEALQDESKFVEFMQRSGLLVNDFKPYLSRLAKQSSYELWHLLHFVKFPLAIEGKNKNLDISEFDGFTLQEAIYDRAEEEGEVVHDRLKKVFRAVNGSQPIPLSFFRDGAVPDIGTEARFVQDISLQSKISQDRKEEIDYLQSNLRHDGFSDFLRDEFEADFLIVAENNHNGKGTRRFWKSDETFKACQENGITVFAIEWNNEFQPLIEALHCGKITYEEFIQRGAALQIKLIDEIETSDDIHRDATAAFAKAYRPSEIREGWVERADIVLSAKKYGMRVFAFDKWEGTYLDREGALTIQSRELRTAKDHEWADRIGNYCKGDKAIVRIGAAHNPDQQLAQYGSVIRLALCENRRSLIRNRDIFSLASLALLANYPSTPVTAVCFEQPTKLITPPDIHNSNAKKRFQI